MIERRRKPRTRSPLSWKPSSSGPRWRWMSAMRLTSPRADSSPEARGAKRPPHRPHMLVALLGLELLLDELELAARGERQRIHDLDRELDRALGAARVLLGEPAPVLGREPIGRLDPHQRL